ncbi:MAG: hypothetical protein GF311_06170 [Candidatus Lokiarchaeota archaeon]|nr:hypothetical protein [Candidatus Lokiarchaeota archaeon]
MTVWIEKAPYTHKRTKLIVEYFSEILNQIPAKCWVAGGAIVSSFMETPIKDIDLYFPNKENWELAKDFLLSLNTEATYEGENSFKIKLGKPNEVHYRDRDKSIFFGNAFDLVSNFRKTPSSTIKSFDIIACCMAIDADKTFYYVDGAINDIENKIIRYNDTHDIIGPEERFMQRINKYGRKGFELSGREATKFLKAMNKAKKKNTIFGFKLPYKTNQNWLDSI